MRPFYSRSILSLLFGAAALVQAVPSPPAVPNPKALQNPEPCTGVCGFVHDPTVVIRESDGTYFRFVTDAGLQVATAPSLQGPWVSQDPLLPNGSKVPISGQTLNSLWAPDAHLIGDTYYVYYAVSSLGSQNSGIGVVTSTTMEAGSWVDHGSLDLPLSADYNLIDANLFSKDGSSFLLTFGSYWKGIYQISMSDPLTISAGATPKNVAYNPAKLPALEGSYQFWWATGGVDYYYIFLSKGICCDKPPNLPPAGQEYSITVCRSTSPTGPFIDRAKVECLKGGGTPVLSSHGNVYAPGGQGVIYDPNLKSIVLYYHYIDPRIGYETEDFQFGYNLISMDSDGWPHVSS